MRVFIFVMLLVLPLGGTEAHAQNPAKRIWNLNIDYFWGGGSVNLVVQPGGGADAPDNIISGVSKITFIDYGATVQVTATFESPFSGCKVTLTATAPVSGTSKLKATGTLLDVFGTQPDPCTNAPSDITFSAETYADGPLTYTTARTVAPFTVKRRVRVYPENDGGPYLLVDPDNIATGAGGNVIVENKWGLVFDIKENTNWIVWRLGGLIHRPSGQAPSRVHFQLIRQAGDPPCFLQDYCVMMDNPPGQFRVPNSAIQNCPVGTLCLRGYITLTDIFLYSPTATSADQAPVPRAAITLEVGSGEVIDSQGTVKPITAGQTVEFVGPNPTLVAAVAPASRSVQVPTTATAFATILNAGPGPAMNCRIALDETQSLPLQLSFWATDPNTNSIVGEQDASVDLPAPAAGQVTSQPFVFALKPTAAFTATDVRLNHTCNGSQTVTQLVGINTLLLSASNDPVPDHIAVGLTPSNDGYARIPGAGNTGIFVIASTNIGVDSVTTARLRLSDPSMPVTASVCETNPSTGVCKQTQTPTVTRTIAKNEATTWTAFLTATGPLPPDPARYRAFFEFLDAGGVVRGSTSTAVRVD